MSQGDPRPHLLQGLQKIGDELSLFEEWLLPFLRQKQQTLQSNISLLSSPTNNFPPQSLTLLSTSLSSFSTTNLKITIQKQFQWISPLQLVERVEINGIDKLTEAVVRVELPPEDIPATATQIEHGSSVSTVPVLVENEEEARKEDKGKKVVAGKPEIVSFDVYPPKEIGNIRERITKQVRQLSMNNNHLGNQLCEIIKEVSPDELAYLSLENDDIDEKGIGTLVTCIFPKLNYLYLGNNKIADNLNFQDKNWSGLKYLSLTNNKITDKGIISFSRFFKDLNSLSLKLNPIGDIGLQKLLSDNLQNLEYLHLQSCKITNQATFLTEKGQQPTQLKKLEKVYLNGNNISGKALQNLLSSNLMNTIKILNLQKNTLKSSDIQLLKKQQSKLKSLTSLDLSTNKLRTLDIQPLFSIALPLLDHLYLKNNELDTIPCLRYFTKTELPCLRSLQVDGNKINSKDEYIVKSMVEDFYSVKVAKRLSKIHIHV